MCLVISLVHHSVKINPGTVFGKLLVQESVKNCFSQWKFPRTVSNGFELQTHKLAWKWHRIIAALRAGKFNGKRIPFADDQPPVSSFPILNGFRWEQIYHPLMPHKSNTWGDMEREQERSLPVLCAFRWKPLLISSKIYCLAFWRGGAPLVGMFLPATTFRFLSPDWMFAHYWLKNAIFRICDDKGRTFLYVSEFRCTGKRPCVSMGLVLWKQIGEHFSIVWL